MKAVGWTALIALVFELASAFWDIASGAARARYETELFEKAQNRIGGTAGKLIDAQNKKLEDQLKLLQRRRELGEITEKEFTEQSTRIINETQNVFDQAGNQVEQTIEKISKEIKALETAIEAGGQTAAAAGQGSDLLNKLGIEISGDAFNRLSKLRAEVKALQDVPNGIECSIRAIDD
jgi:uncharacterized protein YukE